MRIAGLVVGAGAALFACGAVLAQAPGGDPAANWEAITQCAREESAGSRHNCIDDVLRKAGLLDRTVEIAQQRETFGQPSREIEEEQQQQAAERDWEKPAKLDSIASTIAFAKLNERRKLVVVTADGQVWRQTSDETIHTAPKAGLAFEAETAAMGGFRCKVGKYTSFRCERLD